MEKMEWYYGNIQVLNLEIILGNLKLPFKENLLLALNLLPATPVNHALQGVGRLG